MDLDPVDVIKLSLTQIITVLILDANTTIVVELAPEMDMIGLLDSQIVTGS